jgi:L-iditol 2-dehydrogenase
LKALVYHAIQDLRIEEIEKPACLPKGLLLKVKACGLCGGDVRTYFGGHKSVTPPWIIGHEIAGVVEEVGSQTKGFHKGDRLAVAPVVYCGKCPFCLQGKYYLCQNVREIAQHWPGGFAEFIAIPEEALKLGNVNPIPESLSFEGAAISEPPSSCLNAQDRAQVGMGDSVVIIGAGPVGCFHCEIARIRGALKIIMVDLLNERLKLAERFNPDLLLDSNDSGYLKRIGDETQGLGADVVIVACSSIKAQQDALEIARNGGRVIFFGGLPPGKSSSSLDVNLLHYKNLQVFGAYSFSPEHHRLSLELMSKRKIRAKNYITHVIPLENIIEGIKAVKEGRALKVVIRI